MERSKLMSKFNNKNGVIIDNRYIVPYNPKLLRKYQAHLNIE